MYAIFQSGGKQHRVKPGQMVCLEKLKTIPQNQNKIEFDQVLMLVNDNEVRIGTPTLKGVVVRAEVIFHDRAKKIKIVKFKRRKHYEKQQGHRQWYTKVKITEIIY
ncbi:MAG: 50S ribosomal protein L21 [Candidatus Dasytiphilus stammeri]